ncbi:filamin [Bryobacterales bacterium F-183]|nr:filamin [Bryobacterales bacterium F-183]
MLPRRSVLVALALSAPVAALAQNSAPQAEFDRLIKPLFAKSCNACHNDRMASGSLNLVPYANYSSLTEGRETWEHILRKIRSGEMPPKGMPKPSLAAIEEILSFVNREFEKADAKVKPDSGRVTARRLNRNEYTNTIRDLLSVDFRAERDFPTDDSGHGFDNIADVLTISPMLMDKYLRAAERIAARAIGADPLPEKPVEAQYHTKDMNLRRIDRSTVEASHRIEWDAEYIVRIGLPGERAKDAAPVKFGFFMDGKMIFTKMVETKPSGLEYFNPYSEEEFRIVLPEGDHVFRAAFIDDEVIKTFTNDKDAYNSRKNKYLNMIKFVGPFPAKVEKASRKRILICDPNTGGNACLEKIIGNVAHRAFRRPVTKKEVAGLMTFVDMAKADGQSTEQGLQLAIQAILVSPHFLFRIERDAPGTDIHPVTEVELASRLSYFLWTSMPDDELLGLAESGKLRANLDAQIKRMLLDKRAAAFAANFAGQWLETRNLDSVKPDPGKFPDWGPELRDAMKMETNLFFEHLLRENRPLAEFIDAPYTFLNERLAKHYGIEGVTGGDFRRVDLSNNPQRGGILSHASVLTVSSYPTRTSPVIRGKYILQNVLGAPPPAPPPDVPTLNEEAVGTTLSLRKQMEQHRSNPACSTCHNRMDALGFGLENYDAIGRWRTLDGKFPIDVAGTFPNGKSFDTPAQMRSLLRDDLPDFARCLTEKMLTYALGRGLEKYDKKTVEGINKKLAAENYPFQTMVFEIARSLPFQARRREVSQNNEKSKSPGAAKAE